MAEPIGFKWIAEHLEIAPVHPLRIESYVGSGRRTTVGDDVSKELYPAMMRPESTLRAHLSFGLRHESVHLEFLARVFDRIAPSVLEDWIRDEPTGSFARRACFFYEWLSGRRLDVPDVVAGNYVDALPEDQYLTATRPVNSQRWRVRDNLPGTVDFCPLVVRTKQVVAAEQYDCTKALQELEGEFGADLLMRSAVWLSIKESRASFAIEHEEKQVDRIKRFARVMEQRIGQGIDPLEVDALGELQADILGRATRYGLRKSPVFVGHASGYADVVDYVGPHWEHTLSLLGGLRQFMQRTLRRSPVLRAAVASFGFVYIHPMADGNGRISRFLVNDVLRRDQAVPAPFILPISAAITNSTAATVGYDRTLERFSRPLMARYRDQYSFGKEYVCEDGVVSNFHFDAYADALPAWRYPDLTSHVEYMGQIVRATIESEMTKEAIFMRNFDRAREGVKNWLEGPNADIDRIIRSVSQDNAWRVSNKLSKEFPQLADKAVADGIVQAVKDAFVPAEEIEGNEPENGPSP